MRTDPSLWNQEANLLREFGSKVVGAPAITREMGDERFIWRLQPKADLMSDPECQLHIRYTRKRPECAHYNVVLRRQNLWRLDLNDVHRDKKKGLLEGNHVHELRQLGSARIVIWNLVPPLDWPESFPEQSTVPYWKPLIWFADRYKIDIKDLDQNILEEVYP